MVLIDFFWCFFLIQRKTKEKFKNLLHLNFNAEKNMQVDVNIIIIRVDFDTHLNKGL